MTPQAQVKVQSSNPVAQQDQTRIGYEYYLGDMGDKLNCYFTIERDDTDTVESAFDEATVVQEDVDTLDGLVAKLNRELTGITASRDPSIPSVIHLVENRLKVDGYVMERRVSLNYTGTPYGLLVQLRDQFGGIGPRASGVGFYIQDPLTPVTANVQDVTVRQVLTGAVPLPGYNRIVWEASTRIDENNQSFTDVFFWGPIENEEP